MSSAAPAAPSSAMASSSSSSLLQVGDDGDDQGEGVAESHSSQEQWGVTNTSMLSQYEAEVIVNYAHNTPFNGAFIHITSELPLTKKRIHAAVEHVMGETMNLNNVRCNCNITKSSMSCGCTHRVKLADFLPKQMDHMEYCRQEASLRAWAEAKKCQDRESQQEEETAKETFKQHEKDEAKHEAFLRDKEREAALAAWNVSRQVEEMRNMEIYLNQEHQKMAEFNLQMAQIWHQRELERKGSFLALRRYDGSAQKVRQEYSQLWESYCKPDPLLADDTTERCIGKAKSPPGRKGVGFPELVKLIRDAFSNGSAEVGCSVMGRALSEELILSSLQDPHFAATSFLEESSHVDLLSSQEPHPESADTDSLMAIVNVKRMPTLPEPPTQVPVQYEVGTESQQMIMDTAIESANDVPLVAQVVHKGVGSYISRNGVKERDISNQHTPLVEHAAPTRQYVSGPMVQLIRNNTALRPAAIQIYDCICARLRSEEPNPDWVSGTRCMLQGKKKYQMKEMLGNEQRFLKLQEELKRLAVFRAKQLEYNIKYGDIIIREMEKKEQKLISKQDAMQQQLQDIIAIEDEDIAKLKSRVSELETEFWRLSNKNV
eukprot:GILK01005609.1.p1 GENE.GILK01005609.1~~GILK01005609.1.p1  ORF type:complete len:602 (+),score=153.33 GILK01005609.1:1359-3164(+)